MTNAVLTKTIDRNSERMGTLSKGSHVKYAYFSFSDQIIYFLMFFECCGNNDSSRTSSGKIGFGEMAFNCIHMQESVDLGKISCNTITVEIMQHLK